MFSTVLVAAFEELVPVALCEGVVIVMCEVVAVVAVVAVPVRKTPRLLVPEAVVL